MIYYLPLEYLDKRYTKLLDKQIQRELRKQKKKFKIIHGKALSESIDTGAFLDSNSTIYFKMSQIQKIAELFRKKKIKDGDVFFVSDLWFPGIESIEYMAFFAGIKVKIKGLLHAGSFTETDFVRGMEDWAKWTEKGWFKLFDSIYLGSNFIKQELIQKGRIIDFKKLKVTGLPFNTQDLYKLVKPLPWNKKKDIVLFAGRLDDEKQPWVFDELKKACDRRFGVNRIQFIKTMEHNLDKKAYLQLLAESKIVFSAALQENFGYSMLEASAYNCNLLLPNRLVYPEFYPNKFLYENDADIENLVNKVALLLQVNVNSTKYAEKHNKNIEKIVKDL
jgi:glycosyltransferase involved in cell wall biosynthesis